MKKTIFVGVLAIFLILPMASAYEITFSATNLTTSTTQLFIKSASLFPDPSTTCTITTESFSNLTSGSSFTGIATYNSPYGLNPVTIQKENLQTDLCSPFTKAIYSTLSANGTYEAESTLVHGATSGGTWTILNQYSCSTTNHQMEFIVNRTQEKDTDNLLPFWLGFESVHTGGSPMSRGDIVDDFGTCNATAQTLLPVKNTSVFSFDQNDNARAVYVFPFNSSWGGQTSIKMDLDDSWTCTSNNAGSGTKNFRVDLIKLSDLSSVNFYTQDSNCFGGADSTGVLIDETLPLDENEIYTAMISATGPTTAFSHSYTLRPPLWINISVNGQIPDYDCGEYTACVDGEKSRFCEDTTGFFSDIVEIDTCITPTEYQSVIFDFETVGETYRYVDPIVQAGFWGSLLPTLADCVVGNFTAELPVGWNFSSNFFDGTTIAHETWGNVLNGRYADLVSSGECLNCDGANNTATSLRINNRPVTPWMIDDTDGSAPALCVNGSTAFFPEINTTDLSGVFSTEEFTFPTNTSRLRFFVKSPNETHLVYQWSGYFGTLFNLTDFELCYGECFTKPVGYYIVSIHNSTNKIFEITGTATNSWQLIDTWLAPDLGIVGGQNYTIQITTGSQSVQDTTGYSILIDELEILNDNLPPDQDPDFCEDRCVDTTFVDATLGAGGSCSEKFIENDPFCISQIEEVNNATEAGDWFDDLLGTFGYNQTVLDDADLGYVPYFFSGQFLVLGLFLLIGTFIEIKARTGGIAFIGTMILGMILMVGIGLLEVWIAIIFGIISSAIIAFYAKKAFGGE